MAHLQGGSLIERLRVFQSAALCGFELCAHLLDACLYGHWFWLIMPSLAYAHGCRLL